MKGKVNLKINNGAWVKMTVELQKNFLKFDDKSIDLMDDSVKFKKGQRQNG